MIEFWHYIEIFHSFSYQTGKASYAAKPAGTERNTPLQGKEESR